MLCYNPDHVSSIIDDTNTFISIQHKDVPIIEWKDSLRIFPTSLNNLCRMFGADGKSMSYNDNFKSINIFNNSELLELFIKYSLQDAKSLFKALHTAQFIYFDKFKVDIESVYSTATLSLKIFRTMFQQEQMFILPPNIDITIRSAYFGGGTDVYKAYAQNVYYYDVNSLYPYAMLNDMPNDILHNGKLIDLTYRSLDSFFGFAHVKIVCPLDMERPVLPYHHEGKTIYPVGSWQGVYFSEELKAVEKLGYQIILIKGYEFTKFKPFNGYINNFYEIKKNSTSVERDIAKLQLNNQLVPLLIYVYILII
jgi:DNA polymerase type B, organellar and viral